jgi:hypothetical protein
VRADALFRKKERATMDLASRKAASRIKLENDVAKALKLLQI